MVATVLVMAFAADSAQAQDQVAECNGLDRDAVIAALGDDPTMRQMKSWELKAAELLACQDTALTLRLTYWSPENSSKKLGIRYQWVYEIGMDTEKKRVVAPDPTINTMRQATDDAIRVAEADPTVQALAKAAPGVGGVADGSSTVKLLIPEWTGDQTAALVDKDAGLTYWEAPTTVDLPSNPQVTVFKAVAPTVVEGKTCELPETYRVDRMEDSWNFQFTHAKGPCKGDWTLVIDGESNVTWEKL